MLIYTSTNFPHPIPPISPQIEGFSSSFFARVLHREEEVMLVFLASCSTGAGLTAAAPHQPPAALTAAGPLSVLRPCAIPAARRGFVSRPNSHRREGSSTSLPLDHLPPAPREHVAPPPKLLPPPPDLGFHGEGAPRGGGTAGKRKGRGRRRAGRGVRREGEG